MGNSVFSEMIEDAVAGENERLKLFGIKALRIKGSDLIEYRTKDESIQVNKDDHASIRELVTSLLTRNGGV